MDIRLSIFGEEQVSRTILRPAKNAEHPMPLWHSLAEDMVQIETEQFEGEGAFSGGWQPLAASTVEGKAAAGLDPRILHATLALRKSLTEMTGEDAIRIFTEDHFIFGSSVPYGKFHQSGTANMPQRRPVELTNLHRELLVKKVQRFLFTGEVGAL